MGAGGDFGNDTTKGRVQCCLICHARRQDSAILGHDGGRGVVAAGFDSKKQAGHGVRVAWFTHGR